MSQREGSAPIGIVEDDPRGARLLQSQLHGLGYTECFCAADPDGALQMAKEHSPWALLVNAELGDGTVAPRLAAQVRSRWDIPCLFLTAHTDESTLTRCQIADPSGYLVKPVPLEVLRASLATLIDRERIRRDLAGHAQRQRQVESLFYDTLAHVPLAVLLVGEDGLVRFANRAAEGLFARSSQEIVGLRSEVLLQPTTHPELVAAGANCFARTATGREAAAQVHSVNLWRPDETLLAYFIQDARAQVALQRQLSNAQSAVAHGHLGEALAHDLNNLLGALQTLLFLFAEGSAPHAAHLQELEQAIERGSLLSEQLAQLSRTDDWHVQELDLERQLRQLAPLCRRLLGDDVEFDVVLHGPASCRLAPAQLRQILFALLLNAREAMARGGRVTLELAVVDSEPPPHAVVTVSDSGTGLPPAHLARAFDPFYSTKPGHAGLGLVVARRMAEDLGGSLCLASRPATGSRATLVLPLA